MSQQWFRLYAEFATDPKVQMMSEVMQRRLIMLFCLRCSDVTVTASDDEIAFQLRISVEELAETKALFIAKKFIDNAWNIVQWDKRQFASDSSAARTRAYRDRKRDVVVTSHVTNSDALEQNRTEQIQNRTEKAGRGTRLPADWQPSPDDLRWAHDARPDVDAKREVECFRDYWIAKPGKDGVRLDWSATWRNWIRRSNANKTSKPSTSAESPAAGRRL